jgi:hypothetical protein
MERVTKADCIVLHEMSQGIKQHAAAAADDG